jgi:hypothetical protein
MPLRGDTLKAMALELSHTSLGDSSIENHVLVLAALIPEIDKLRLLPLKACEPPFIFTPIGD